MTFCPLSEDIFGKISFDNSTLFLEGTEAFLIKEDHQQDFFPEKFQKNTVSSAFKGKYNSNAMHADMIHYYKNTLLLYKGPTVEVLLVTDDSMTEHYEVMNPYLLFLHYLLFFIIRLKN